MRVDGHVQDEPHECVAGGICPGHEQVVDAPPGGGPVEGRVLVDGPPLLLLLPELPYQHIGEVPHVVLVVGRLVLLRTAVTVSL